MQHTPTAIYAIFFNLCSVLYKPESCALALFVDLNIDLGFRRKLVSRDVCHLFFSATCLSLQEVGLLTGQGCSGMTLVFVASVHNHTYTPSKWHVNGTCLSDWVGNWASKVAQKMGSLPLFVGGATITLSRTELCCQWDLNILSSVTVMHLYTIPAIQEAPEKGTDSMHV